MANLLGSNIGTNYKSILNLDATTINTPLDATLRAVTDGMGTSSPLQLSTTKVAIGTNLYFNGITSAFPMIKRNGAAIDFRLADDSGYCDLTAKKVVINQSSIFLTDQITFGSGISGGLNTLFNNGASWIDDGGNMPLKIAYKNGVRFTNGNLYPITIGADSLANASSIVEIVSTTKGFLPPRMTTAQKNAIASPATGLVVYDTTLNKLAVFTTVWEAVTSS